MGISIRHTSKPPVMKRQRAPSSQVENRSQISQPTVADYKADVYALMDVGARVPWWKHEEKRQFFSISGQIQQHLLDVDIRSADDGAPYPGHSPAMPATWECWDLPIAALSCYDCQGIDAVGLSCVSRVQQVCLLTKDRQSKSQDL